jgi:hypothetical protein
MAYRLKDGVPLVLVKQRNGAIAYHYAKGPVCPGAFGPVIPWLNDEQREHWLRLGLVEEIDEDVPEVPGFTVTYPDGPRPDGIGRADHDDD